MEHYNTPMDYFIEGEVPDNTWIWGMFTSAISDDEKCRILE